MASIKVHKLSVINILQLSSIFLTVAVQT